MGDPFATTEARWFHRGPLDDGIRASFVALAPSAETEPPRTDTYLSLDSDALGIKWRGGRLEVKGRLDALRRQELGAGLYGDVESWMKWSAEASSAPELPAPGTQRGVPWVEVRKDRISAWYRMGAGRALPMPVPSGSAPTGACAAELANVVVGGTSCWTFGLEAIGHGAPAAASLLAVVDALAGLVSVMALHAADAHSYPAWLSTRIHAR